MPVAYFAAHGTSDSVLCYDSMSSGCVGNGMALAENFGDANGCTWMTPTKVTNGNHVCTSMMGCDDGYPLEFCSFNGDHTPDPRENNQPSWLYQDVWDFFNQF
jgi:poly(3-hydroxybutyrate) depolymerase